MPEELIGERYRIVEHLGEGGMGTVMIAEHVDLGRRVALKVLQEKIGDDATMRKRFQREAKTLAAMQHPNIVALNDYGVSRGAPYLVMELLEGRTLRDLIDVEGTLPLDRALGIIQQVLRALSYAHANGVIHRDLKPGNVFLQALPDHLDHVKLLDFGFAKFVHSSANTSMVTGDGMLVGTPAYMAPEQATAGKVDQRVDVYAAGVLLFEMLCGRRPFEGPAIELLRRRLANEAPSIHEVRPDFEVAPELEEAMARALTREPASRWQTAAELSSALAALPPDALVAGEGGAPEEQSDEDGPTTVSVAVTHESATTELRSLDLESLPSPTSKRIQEWLDRPSRTADTPAIPQRPFPMWTVFVAAVVFAAVVIAWQAWPSDEPEPLTPPAARVESVEDAPPPRPRAAPAVEPSEPPRADAPRDPWQDEIPPELAELRDRITRAPRPSPSDLRIVASYGTNHPDDVRPELLLAHGYVKARSLGDSIERYEHVLSRDRTVRGDPQMLADLISLSTSHVYTERASQLLIDTYGAEALYALDAAIQDARNARIAARLREIRDRIAAPPDPP